MFRLFISIYLESQKVYSLLILNEYLLNLVNNKLFIFISAIYFYIWYKHRYLVYVSGTDTDIVIFD